MEYTLKNISELVEKTKDFTANEQTMIALSLPITVCSLYCVEMENKYGKKVNI